MTKATVYKHLLAGIRLHLREIEAHSVIQTVRVVSWGTALDNIAVLPWRCDIKWTACTRPRGGALKLLCKETEHENEVTIMLHHTFQLNVSPLLFCTNSS